MKVLFLGGGRRVSLAKRFIAEGFEVFSYETEDRCPISLYATVIQGFRWTDVRCKQNIINTIVKYDIDLVIPLQDAGTRILSQIKMENVELTGKLPIPDLKASTLCLDKSDLEWWFYTCSRSPIRELYPWVKNGSDVIVKPIKGANSKGIKRISYTEYCLNYFEKNTDCVAQRFIPGEEYSIDAYFNKLGKFIDCVPRKRTEVQGGEVNRSVTVIPGLYNLSEHVKNIGEALEIKGPTCFQFIIDEDHRPYLMEINARFGGGVILSLEAGLNMVQLLKTEYVDNKAITDNTSWQVGKSMTRYFEEYFYDI